jgi:hypothetical protein
VRAFVEQLTLPQVAKIRTTFFDTMPRLSHTFTFTVRPAATSKT